MLHTINENCHIHLESIARLAVKRPGDFFCLDQIDSGGTGVTSVALSYCANAGLLAVRLISLII